jgi:integrase/recombinase XerD
VKYLTIEELYRMITGAPLQIQAMCLTSFRHGLRASETTGLLRSDIDLAAKTIVVRRLKGSLKTVQALGDDETRLLTDWLAVAPASAYAFCNAFGKRLNRATWFRWFRDTALKAGIHPSKRHCHVLKHGLGMALILNNTTLPVVQRALGHKSLSSTACYTQASDEMADKAIVEALGK